LLCPATRHFPCLVVGDRVLEIRTSKAHSKPIPILAPACTSNMATERSPLLETPSRRLKAFQAIEAGKTGSAQQFQT
jgi:hypothetical protein